MEKVTDTWVTVPQRPDSMTNRGACLIHIYPTGPGMGTRYTLSRTPMNLGHSPGGRATIYCQETGAEPSSELDFVVEEERFIRYIPVRKPSHTVNVRTVLIGGQ